MWYHFPFEHLSNSCDLGIQSEIIRILNDIPLGKSKIYCFSNCTFGQDGYVIVFLLSSGGNVYRCLASEKYHVVMSLLIFLGFPGTSPFLIKTRAYSIGPVCSLGWLSLDSMVDDWDAIPEVRTRMRQQRTLFVKEDGKEKPEATISCGELNFHVLKPLVEKLEESPGVLGMHSVPHLQKQILDWYYINYVVCKIDCPIYFQVAFVWESFMLSTKWCYKPSLVLIQLKDQVTLPEVRGPHQQANFEVFAKLAKKFMVLVKRKLQRDQVCRSVLFRKLLALAFASTRANAEDLVVIQNGFQWFHGYLQQH